MLQVNLASQHYNVYSMKNGCSFWDLQLHLTMLLNHLLFLKINFKWVDANKLYFIIIQLPMYRVHPLRQSKIYQIGFNSIITYVNISVHIL